MADFLSNMFACSPKCPINSDIASQVFNLITDTQEGTRLF